MPEFNRYESAGILMARALRAQGLPVPSSFVGSTDPAAILLLELATELGRELNSPGKWQLFDRTHTFTTASPTLNYPVPDDLEYYIDGTGWNLTARVPLIGPMTPQQWALLQARQLGGTTLYMQFQVAEDEIQFYFVPSDPQDVSIAYQGRGWVQDGTVSTTYRDFVKNDSDIVQYDPLLFQLGLINLWRDRKGFDTTRSSRKYEDRLSVCLAKDSPSPDLHTSRQTRYPYLGLWNLPDTGYGSSS